ncbi:MAG: glycosyltransferase family 4 protein [Chloroflexota bacterium]
MRVLLATSQFAPEPGGVPRLLWQFSDHRPADIELRVLSVRQQPPAFYAAFDARAPFPIERVPPLPVGGLTSARFAARLLAAIRRWRPHLILCGVAYPTAIIAEMATRLVSVPYVVYAHSEDITIPGQRRRRALARALWRASAVITVSDFTRRELGRLGLDPQQVTLIPPGIELERFAQPAPLPALESRPASWTLLTVARLVWRKGQDTVIRALPRILERVPQAHYLIVGSGPDTDGLRALAADLGVSGHVTFAGRVSDADLPAYYRACDAFVMPTRPSHDGSEVEGFGIVYLEAAAAGKPVIGGRAGGVADAVLDGQTGLLVDPSSVDQVAEAVLSLALNPALARRLGEAGRERVRREFSAETFAARVSGVLERAVAPQKGSVPCHS